jgi:hypothetical protein
MQLCYLKSALENLDIYIAIVIKVSSELTKLQFYLLPSRSYENCTKTDDQHCDSDVARGD